MDPCVVRPHVSDVCTSINLAFAAAHDTADSFAVDVQESWCDAARRAVASYVATYDDGEWNYACDDETFIAAVHQC